MNTLTRLRSASLKTSDDHHQHDASAEILEAKVQDDASLGTLYSTTSRKRQNESQELNT